MTPPVARLPRASIKSPAKSIAAAPRSLAPALVGGMYFTGREEHIVLECNGFLNNTSGSFLDRRCHFIEVAVSICPLISRRDVGLGDLVAFGVIRVIVRAVAGHFIAGARRVARAVAIAVGVVAVTAGARGGQLIGMVISVTGRSGRAACVSISEERLLAAS